MVAYKGCLEKSLLQQDKPNNNELTENRGTRALEAQTNLP